VSGKPERTLATQWAVVEQRVHEFFEPQLRALRLTVDQIEEQDLSQLEASLDILNDAIANPDSFGKISFSFGGEAGPIIVKSRSAAHVELGILPILLERKGLVVDRIREGATPYSATAGSAMMQEKFAILRVDIDGSWPVDNLIKLLTQLEQAYLAAAALESLTEPSRMGISISAATPREYTADELLRAVVAFRLGGGLRVGSIHYGSPGFLEFIGALNPLKTVKDGVTENRDINRKREETKLYDERERQRQSMEHEQALEKERRRGTEIRLEHERELAKLQMKAAEVRAQTFLSVMDRLPPAQRTAAASDLFQLMIRNAESIANDARVGEMKILESGEPAASETS